MQRSWFLIFFLAFSLISKTAHSSEKSSEYLLAMLSHNYESAEYRVGLNRIRDLESKVAKEEGQFSISMGHIYAWKAMIYASLSKFNKYGEAMAKSEAILKQCPKDSSTYWEANLTLARAHEIYGDYKTCLTLLTSDVIDLHKNPITYYEYIYYINLCKYKLGYLVDVEADIACDREVVEALTDTSQQINILKANMLFLHLDVLLNVGDRYHSKLLILEYEPWVKATFGYKHGFKAELLYRKGLIASQRNKIAEANTLFKRSYASGLKFYAMQSPFFIRLQNARVNNLLKTGKRSEADYWQNDLDVRLLGYYGRKSVPFYDHKFTEVEVYYETGEWKKALHGLKKYEKQTNAYPENHIGRLRILEMMYAIYLKNWDMDAADSTMQKMVTLAEEKYGKEAPNFHFKRLEQIKHQYTYSNKISGLEQDYRYSLFHVLKHHVSEHHDRYYPLAFDLVRLYTLNENYKDADLTMDALLTELRQNKNHHLAEGLSLSSQTKTDIGVYVLASKHVKEALWMLKDKKAKEEKLVCAHAHLVHANVQKETGDFNGAMTSYHHAERVLSDPIFTAYAIPIEEKAWIEINNGKYRRTKKELTISLADKQLNIGGNHWSTLIALMSLAEINMLEGEYTQAEKQLNQVQGIVDTVFGKNSIKQAEILLMQKDLYNAVGDYEKSEESITQAVQILEQKYGQRHVKTALPISELALAIALNNEGIGDSLLNANLAPINEKCRAYLFEAQEIIKNEFGSKNPLYAEVLENSGKYALLTQDLEEAVATISEARFIWKEVLGEPNVHTAHLDFLLGEIAYYGKDYTQAQKNFTSSKDAYKELFGSYHPSYVEALGWSARMYFIQGETKNAVTSSEEVVDKSLQYIHSIFPSLSERGKANYWGKVKEHFEFYNTLAFKYSATYPNMVGKVFDINLQTKAILLNSSLKIKNEIMGSGDTLLIHSFEQWMDEKENLISAVSMEQDQRKKEGIDLAALENEIERLEKYLGEQATGFNSLKTNQHRWQDVTKVLGKEDQAIEIIAFRLYETDFTDSIWYAVLGVNNATRGSPKYRLIKNGNYLHNEGISYYRNCMIHNFPDQLSYSTFWAPIKGLVTKPGKVYISFDGVYNRLNLEAIRTPNNEFVLNQHEIIPIGTTRDLLENHDTKNVDQEENTTACFVGNPDFYSFSYKGRKSWGQLKGTEKEVDDLSAFLTTKNWKTEVYKHNQATEKVVKSLKSPKVFHVATHGFYVEEEKHHALNKVISNAAENPLLRSGVLLKHGGELYEQAKVHEFNREDGILTAYEAMNLSLENTNLVVLSACETGLGEVELGEGVFGLQRSFVVAGANSIIISLFKVSDKVTTELMNSFYAHWNETGTSHTAFLQAKKEIMEKYDDPKYWGAFVMIGEE